MQEMTRQELQEFIEDYEQGLITPQRFFANRAQDNATERFYDYKKEAILTILGGAIGFALMGVPGAIALSLLASTTITSKLQRGREAFKEIEEGNLINYLPPSEAKLYSKSLEVGKKKRSEPTLEVKAKEIKNPLYPDNPWMKDAKESTVKSKGNSIKKLTLQEDNFIDKVDKTVESSVNNYVGEQFEEIRHVQGEQMDFVNARLDNFEKTFMSAIEKLASTPATENFSKNQKSGEPADVSGFQPSTFASTIGSTPSSTEDPLPSPPVGIKLAFNVFDPRENEQQEEFAYFKALVELEKLSPRGVPIMNRMWGVSSGGSDKCKAARSRRDIFAARLEDFGNYKLYGG